MKKKEHFTRDIAGDWQTPAAHNCTLRVLQPGAATGDRVGIECWINKRYRVWITREQAEEMAHVLMSVCASQ